MIRIGSFVRHATASVGLGRVVALDPVMETVLVVWSHGVQKHKLRFVREVKTV